MTTFALDTSTPSPGLALLRDDRTVAELHLAAAPEAGRRVLQAAHGLLQAAGTDVADLTRIVVGLGPGGFTGLRIGISTALGLGQALGCPVIGAVSLEALALGIVDVAGDGALVAAVTDARRREVFAALYRHDGGDRLIELIPPTAIDTASLARRLTAHATMNDPVLVAGDGAHILASNVQDASVRVLPARSPAHVTSAAALARRAAAGGERPVAPVYARLPDAEVNRLRALAADPAPGV